MQEETIFELIHNMDKFTNQLIIQWNKIFNEDLGISHVLVLGHLMSRGKGRPSDLAKTLGLTPATLTHLSEKLVKKNLVSRVSDESDRRISYLHITDKGIDTVIRANQEGQLLRRKLFEKLTEEERQQLANIYKKLNSQESNASLRKEDR